MSSIVVITFETMSEAGKARQALHKAQKEGYLELVDVVIVIKLPDGKVKVMDEVDKGVTMGAIAGSFLGLLISGIFFPITSLVLGALGGGVIGKMVGMGFDKQFIKEVSQSLKPGNSAIFFVLQDGHLDYVNAIFKPYQGQIYHSSLPEDAEESLRAVLNQRVGQLDNLMIALGLEGQTAADEMLSEVLSWQERGIITLEDAVVASRGFDARVKIRQTKTLTGKYTLKGGGLGLLAGILLGGPLGGFAVGAAVGAIAGKRKDTGIDDYVIKDISDELRPDTSMLFLLGKVMDPERIAAEFSALDAVVVATCLSEEQHANLRKLLDQNTIDEA